MIQKQCRERAKKTGMSSTLHKPTHIIANEVLKRKEVERELRMERGKGRGRTNSVKHRARAQQQYGLEEKTE